MCANNTNSNTLRAHFEQRARHWFERAVPNLKGLAKVRVQQKLQSLSVVEFPINLASVVSRKASGVQWLQELQTVKRLPLGRLRSEKSWVLYLEFMPNSRNGRQVIFFWGDRRPGKDPLYVDLEDGRIRVAWEDNRSGHTQSLQGTLRGEDYGKWNSVLLHYNAKSAQFTAVFNRKEKQSAARRVLARPDRIMTVFLGSGGPGFHRFRGRVRSVWFGNVRDVGTK